jgi:hypothetical protein
MVLVRFVIGSMADMLMRTWAVAPHEGGEPSRALMTQDRWWARRASMDLALAERRHRLLGLI